MNNSIILSSIGYVNQNIITAPSGRQYYRHASNQASVMIYSEKKKQNEAIIPDCLFRTNLPWGAYNVSTGLTLYATMNLNPFGGSSTLTTTTASTITDTQLDTIFATYYDAQTSKYNTEKLIQISDTEAAHYCYSIKFGEMHCSLPNIQLLARIYCDADFIDSLDPHSASSNYKLSGWKIGGADYTWASTEKSLTDAWGVNDRGYCGNGRYCTKTYQFGVIPIIEL